MSRLPGATRALSVVLAAGLLVACGGAAPTRAPAPATAPPVTPMTSISPAVAAAVAALGTRLAEAGLGLSQSSVEYRPGEPAELQAAPRAVYRANLAASEEGWVLVYDLGSTDAAGAAGQAMASYLASGQGQTNYPRDARFALSVLGSALVFSWWSPERTADAQRAEAVFDAVRSVGQPIEVHR
jgi:hypothetical protein